MSSQDGKDSTNWREQRRAAAAAQADALARRDAQESAQARAMLQDFVVRAHERGLETVRLDVRGYGGKGVARSQVHGWYLRLDKGVGVGEDGEFYVLIAPLSLLDRLRGVTLTPTDPPLIIGKGGGDGDTIDMANAIARLLPPDPGA
jgi:hypothetical protein